MSAVLRGVRARPLRVVLSALGIAIGVAAMVAVAGISASSRASADRQLDALGTNLLTVGPGTTFGGAATHLPETAPAMIRRIGPVTAVSATGRVAGARVYRTDRIPAAESGGIAVVAMTADLRSTVGLALSAGAFPGDVPGVVLGSRAASLLGLQYGIGLHVWIGGHWFAVTGTLAPTPLAPEIDSAALVSWPVAVDVLGFDGYPTTIYTRTRDDAVTAVASVLAATANPESPNEVKVSRPSDALAARAAIDEAFTGLLLGLGGVALLVGGVGVANTMVISVLERRTEIGLRRALGARRADIRRQFLGESLLLSALGGLAGTLLGAAVVLGFATWSAWPFALPLWAASGGLLAPLLVGGTAGLYPAMRAARLAPVSALSGGDGA